MSYCRFQGKSDVYMYHNGEEIVCCACRLEPPELFYSELVKGITQCRTDVLFDTLGGALKHLYDHISAGHYVPKYAIRRLKKEMKEYGLSIIESDYQSQRDKNRQSWFDFWSSIPDEVWEDDDKLLELIKKKRR